MNTDRLQNKNIPVTCDACRELLADGIPAERANDVEAHLAACPACRAEYELLRLMRDGAVSDEPPAGFTQSVLQKVRKERAARARRRSLWQIAGAAAAALVLVPALLIWVPLLGNDAAVSVPEIADTRGAAEMYTATGEEMPKLLFSTAAGIPGDAAENAAENDAAETAAAAEIQTESASGTEAAPASPPDEERKADFSPPPSYVGSQRAEETAAPAMTVATMSVTTATTSSVSTTDTVPTVTGTVKDTAEKAILIENEKGQYWISLPDGTPAFRVGDEVTVRFDGMVAETYPMQIHTVYSVILLTAAETD